MLGGAKNEGVRDVFPRVLRAPVARRPPPNGSSSRQRLRSISGRRNGDVVPRLRRLKSSYERFRGGGEGWGGRVFISPLEHAGEAARDPNSLGACVPLQKPIPFHLISVLAASPARSAAGQGRVVNMSTTWRLCARGVRTPDPCRCAGLVGARVESEASPCLPFWLSIEHWIHGSRTRRIVICM